MPFGYDTLQHSGDVTPVQFADYLCGPLGDLYPRAFNILLKMGEINSFKVANILYIAIQKGNTEEVMSNLERWVVEAYGEPAANTEALIEREVLTRLFFDGMYQKFVSDGLPTVSAGPRIHLLGEQQSTRRQLILPPRLR